MATGVAVRALLRTIPAAQRAVLVLRFYHQLTEREIAGVDARHPPRRKA
ncbi:sigma factor-like helix-turn-helix DNA-binding protein [Streptomyces canus]